jgi:hypothetical protein
VRVLTPETVNDGIALKVDIPLGVIVKIAESDALFELEVVADKDVRLDEVGFAV